MLDRARASLASGEWANARDAFEDVLAQDPSCAEALEELGWALNWLDETDASFDRREAAYRLYLGRGDKCSAARVAMGIAIDSSDLRGMAVAGGWMQRAQTLLSGVELAPEHGWYALWAGHFARAFEHDLPKAQSLAAEAREIAQKLDLRDLDLLAHALEGLIKVTEGNVHDGMRQLDEAAAAAVGGELKDLDTIANTCCFLVHACERVRDLDRAAQWIQRIEVVARRWRVGSFFALCHAEHAAMLVGRGEWEEAERVLRESVATLEARRPVVAGGAIVQLADLRRRQGRIDEACELYARVESNTLAMIGMAAIALDRGDGERCAELVERLRRRAMAEKWVERALALDLLVRSRRDETALRELREVAQKVGTDMIRAIASSAEAVMAADAAEARRHLEDAVDLFERCRAPYEAARARIELAAALQALGRDAFAREELAAAQETFRRLGVVTERRARSPLTKREIEVLRLVARGMSDKEAANELRLSEHTVHRHVANILAKLAAPSRTAAVAEATREGWL